MVEYIWSDDRACWMDFPPKGVAVTTPPEEVDGLVLVKEHKPNGLLDEWVRVYVLAPQRCHQWRAVNEYEVACVRCGARIGQWDTCRYPTEDEWLWAQTSECPGK